MGEHADPHRSHGMAHLRPRGDEHASREQERHPGQGGLHDHHAHMVADFRKRFWFSLILTLPILVLSPGLWDMLGLNAPLTFRGDRPVLFVFSSIVFFYGGWPFLKGFGDELRKRQPGMMTLIAVAISAAYFYSSAVTFGLSGMGFYWELATLIDIMLLGHWIEMKSVLGASGALDALVRLLPSEAHRMKADGNTEDISVSDVVPGDRILVKPGERVPTDGIIISGRTSLDESMLTGESKPVEKTVGAEAIGGSVNGEGAITLEVKKTGGQTYLAQVMDMVSKAQASRSRTQDLANRAAVWLTAIALGGGFATLIVWLALGHDFAFAIERAVTVMVIACPHALGLAVPLVVAVSTSMSASRGLLIRDRAAFERARKLGAVVFDKTGTLTEGRFGVSDMVMLGNLDQNTCLRLAAALESQSEHPIAAGIVRTARERQVTWAPASNFTNLTGRGAQAMVEGREVKVVSPGYLREHNLPVQHPRLDEFAAEGMTTVFLLVDGVVVAAFGMADVVRPESKTAIAQLKAMGIQCMMLTGDSKAVAQRVSKQLGLDDYFADVLPEQKALKIRDVKARGLTVAMVGDGVNDAPALVESDLGVAVGAGTDVAIEAADIVLVSNNPMDVAAILGLSRNTYRKMIQNLLWATGYNTFAIPLAAGVAAHWGLLLTPAVGAVLMSVSTVIVAINAELLEKGGVHTVTGSAGSV